MTSCMTKPIHSHLDSDQDSLKENRPPQSKNYKKQSKRKVVSSSSDESDVDTEATNISQSKRSKLGTADEVLASGDVVQDDHSSSAESSSSSSDTDSDVGSKSQRATEAADTSLCNSKRRTSALIQSDSDSVTNDQEDASNKRNVSDKSGMSEGSAASSSVSKAKKRRKRRAKVESETDSDDDVPLTSRGKSSQSHKLMTSSLDPDLFDAENSSSNDERSNNDSDQESSGETTNRLSSKYSGPASKKESKAAKRVAKQDDKLKIYSEKQRMMREQTVTVPVYQPPKKSLREFLSEQAPQLLGALRHQPQSEQQAEAPKYRKVAKPSRPPKYIEQMEYLQDCPLLHTPAKASRSKAIMSTDTQDSTYSLTGAVIDCRLDSSQQSIAGEEEELPDLLSELTKAREGTVASQCLPESADTSQPTHLLTEEFKQPNSKYDRLNSEGNSQYTDFSQSSSVASDPMDNSSLVGDDSQRTAMSADNSQSTVMSADNSQTESTSSIQVIEKTSPMRQRREAKKLRLRRLLGDTVDLDVVPQLTCEADGVVVLDDKQTTKRQHFTTFKCSFEKKAAKARQLEEERKKQREQKALKVVRNLPDGSQHELSMDAYSNKTAEETGGVHKLAVLKQILKAKLSEKRSEEFKRKEETIKLEALEDELPEDEILDDEYEFSDEEEVEEDKGDSDEEDVGPVLHNSDTEVSGKCEFEKDEALMKRVRAVLDSDEEDVEGEETMTSLINSTYPSADSNRLTESHMLDSLDRILGQQSAPAVAGGEEETTQDAVTDTAGAVVGSTQITRRDTIRKSVNIIDENAQDFDPDMTFTNSASTGQGRTLIGFTQDMFSTQQAEDELEGLCSGQFGTPPPSMGKEEGLPVTQPDDVPETGITTKISAKRKEALQFSDEEESDSEQQTATQEASKEEVDEEGDELDELVDEPEDEEEEPVENEEINGEEKTSAGRTLFLHKPRQTKREKILGEFLEREAELSGDEAGSDEDLDLSAEADVLEMQKCDLENLGTDEQLRSQIAKAHAKQRIDDDARELMLMKEMLLPDGDLHSDSKRQRKFRWRNVDYGSQAMNYADEASDDSGMSGTEAELDPNVKALQEKMEKERAEREAWLKDQRERRVQEVLDESQSQTSESEMGSLAAAAPNQQQGFTFSLGVRKKKAGYVLGKSKKYLERFKELHKNIKEDQRGPISHKNLLFRPISKEDAESQQEMMWKKT